MLAHEAGGNFVCRYVVDKLRQEDLERIEPNDVVRGQERSCTFLYPQPVPNNPSLRDEIHKLWYVGEHELLDRGEHRQRSGHHHGERVVSIEVRDLSPQRTKELVGPAENFRNHSRPAVEGVHELRKRFSEPCFNVGGPPASDLEDFVFRFFSQICADSRRV